jgi:hypothetical protein
MKRDKYGLLDPKGRQDHIVPRVYLRGFLHPNRDKENRRLEVFDLPTRLWALPRTPDELCTESGFYDYSVEKADETADKAFEELENGLAEVRTKLRSEGFQNWMRHREFLVGFAHMLVVRSRMFRDGIVSAAQRQVWLRVLEVSGNKIRYEPFDPAREPDAGAMAKNLSITKMREEIHNLARDFSLWQWSLVTTPFVESPFITSDAPVVMDGPIRDGLRAVSDGSFRVVVPFGWDFAMVGSPRRTLAEGPVEQTVTEMDEWRIITTSGATEYLISPNRLLDMRWFGRVTPAVPLMPR